jgi:uncharacterized delta-60 repeat protein
MAGDLTKVTSRWGALAGLVLMAVLVAPALASADAGSLDKSFGHRGKVVEREVAQGHSAAIDARGRIVTTGDLDSHGRAFALARFKPNGHLDHSFAGDGIKKTRFKGFFASASSVAIGPSHRIVAAGGTNAPRIRHPTRFAVVRYRPDGHLDHSFSGDGRAGVNFVHGNGEERAEAVAVDSRGRIVLAGFVTADGGKVRAALARLKANGHLDRSFGDGGKVITQSYSRASAMAIDGQQRIVIAGRDAIARYKPNGQLDRSFGDTGRAFVSFYNVRGVALQSHGRIIVAGAQPNGRDTKFAVARYTSGGRLDKSFGKHGLRNANFGGSSAAASVAIDSRNRIVAAGSAKIEGKPKQFALARFRPDGPLDGGFGGDGRVTTSFGGSHSGAAAAVIDRRDRIVAAGAAQHNLAVARYLG